MHYLRMLICEMNHFNWLWSRQIQTVNQKVKFLPIRLYFLNHFRVVIVRSVRGRGCDAVNLFNFNFYGFVIRLRGHGLVLRSESSIQFISVQFLLQLFKIVLQFQIFFMFFCQLLLFFVFNLLKLLFLLFFLTLTLIRFQLCILQLFFKIRYFLLQLFLFVQDLLDLLLAFYLFIL